MAHNFLQDRKQKYGCTLWLWLCRLHTFVHPHMFTHRHVKSLTVSGAWCECVEQSCNRSSSSPVCDCTGLLVMPQWFSKTHLEPLSKSYKSMDGFRWVLLVHCSVWFQPVFTRCTEWTLMEGSGFLDHTRISSLCLSLWLPNFHFSKAQISSQDYQKQRR